MAKVWVAQGGFGPVMLNAMFVESVTSLPIDTVGVYSIRIKMSSGSGYYGYFSSEEERQAFVDAWATDRIDVDIEPVPELAELA